MGLEPKCRGQFSRRSEKGDGEMGEPKRVNLGGKGRSNLLHASTGNFGNALFLQCRTQEKNPGSRSGPKQVVLIISDITV